MKANAGIETAEMEPIKAEDQYFILDGDDRLGPFTLEQMLGKLRAEQIKPETLWARPNDGQWRKATELQKLAPQLAPVTSSKKADKAETEDVPAEAKALSYTGGQLSGCAFFCFLASGGGLVAGFAALLNNQTGLFPFCLAGGFFWLASFLEICSQFYLLRAAIERLTKK